MDKKLQYLSEQQGIDANEIFLIVQGEKNNVLPGGTWTSFYAHVQDELLHVYQVKSQGLFKKTYSLIFDKKIYYKDFSKAEFGVNNGNLWLQTTLERSSFVFTSPKLYWISPVGQKLVERINEVAPIVDLVLYTKKLK